MKQEQMDEDSWLLESAKEEEEEDGKGMVSGGAKAEKMEKLEEEEEDDADDVEEEPYEDQGEQSNFFLFLQKVASSTKRKVLETSKSCP